MWFSNCAHTEYKLRRSCAAAMRAALGSAGLAGLFVTLQLCSVHAQLAAHAGCWLLAAVRKARRQRGSACI
ncbi:hypothetical protein IE81DRAFT_31849 [Ceraceosorus guamensis]|uniref:Uncharacterized protein n=1 Tax=Ceraceosorus guamensis TaxID=1522189 RepID=A0A316VP36_9BASI|nr:hypothetical protein IE81DRAFT_31849 [Ceraceosorus guamensis]PWN39399.1 hypothetical protein IE81DRAFT_31849 [Ceraceosorus guamensis]